MEKTICVITEKDGVLSMDIDTDINTALNAFVLFSEVFYTKGVKDVGIEKDVLKKIMLDGVSLAIEETNENFC